MKLDKLPKTTKRKKKRVGRGYGSGKGGHTSGRGAKGTKARSKIGLAFTGTKMRKSFLRKLPLQRGKGKFKPFKPDPLIVNLKYSNLFSKGEEVSLESLVKKGIILERQAKQFGAKILGDGEIKVNLKVKIPCSKSAAAKIEKAGGKVIKLEVKPKTVKTKKKAKSKADKKKVVSKPKAAKIKTTAKKISQKKTEKTSSAKTAKSAKK